MQAQPSTKDSLKLLQARSMAKASLFEGCWQEEFGCQTCTTHAGSYVYGITARGQSIWETDFHPVLILREDFCSSYQPAKSQPSTGSRTFIQYWG